MRCKISLDDNREAIYSLFMMNATEQAARLNSFSKGINFNARAANGDNAIHISRYFEFKGRVYNAVRHNGGKLEVYFVPDSRMERWVGYAHEVSLPLEAAAGRAVAHLDRQAALAHMAAA